MYWFIYGVVGFSNSTKATAETTKTPEGFDIASNESYMIWESIASKNVYLTGNEFHSSKNYSGGTYYQIVSSDNKPGPISVGQPFTIRSDASGQFWNWSSDMKSAHVYLGNSAIPDVDHLTHMEGSSFAVSDPRVKEGYPVVHSRSRWSLCSWV